MTFIRAAENTNKAALILFAITIIRSSSLSAPLELGQRSQHLWETFLFKRRRERCPSRQGRAFPETVKPAGVILSYYVARREFLKNISGHYICATVFASAQRLHVTALKTLDLFCNAGEKVSAAGSVLLFPIISSLFQCLYEIDCNNFNSCWPFLFYLFKWQLYRVAYCFFFVLFF